MKLSCRRIDDYKVELNIVPTVETLSVEGGSVVLDGQGYVVGASSIELLLGEEEASAVIGYIRKPKGQVGGEAEVEFVRCIQGEERPELSPDHDYCFTLVRVLCPANAETLDEITIQGWHAVEASK